MIRSTFEADRLEAEVSEPGPPAKFFQAPDAQVDEHYGDPGRQLRSDSAALLLKR